MLHGDDDARRARHQIHGAAHARHHLARHLPVGQMPGLVDLQPAQNRHVQMPAPDQAEAHGAVDAGSPRHSRDKAAARIRQMPVFHALRRTGAKADHAVFGLEEHTGRRRHEIRHHRRQANAEVHQRSRPDFPRNTAGDEFLAVHAGLPHAARTRRWSTSTPGVFTPSGGITPTGTMLSASAMTVFPASAITGLKFCAVSR